MAFLSKSMDPLPGGLRDRLTTELNERLGDESRARREED